MTPHCHLSSTAAARNSHDINPYQSEEGIRVNSPTPKSAECAPQSHSEGDSAKAHTPRAQLIARYRREMMDLVKDAPESSFELSLRDLVEMPPARERGSGRSAVVERETARREKSAAAARGFLLRTFFPFVGMPKRRRRDWSFGGGYPSNVSPRPSFIDRKNCGSGRSSDGERSNKIIPISSSSTRELKGCCSFFQADGSRARGLKDKS